MTEKATDAEFVFPVLPVPAQGTITVPPELAAERDALMQWRDTLLRRWNEVEGGFRQRLQNQREVIDNLDKARSVALKERNDAEARNAGLVLEMAQLRQYWDQHGQGFRDQVSALALEWARSDNPAWHDCARQVLALLDQPKPCVGTTTEEASE